MINNDLIRMLCFILMITMLTEYQWKEYTSADRAYGAKQTILHKNKIKVGDNIWIESMMECSKMLNLITNTEDVFYGQDFRFTMNVVNFKMDCTDNTWTSSGVLSDFAFVN